MTILRLTEDQAAANERSMLVHIAVSKRNGKEHSTVGKMFEIQTSALNIKMPT
jgi:hypothetical protein